MADGSITFSTALDNKQLEKDLKDAMHDVDSIKRKLEGQQFEQSWLEKMLERTKGRIEEAGARVDELNDKLSTLEAEQNAIDTDSMDPAALQRWRELGDEILETYGKIHSAHDELDRRLSENEGYGKRWDVATAKLQEYEGELARARERAAELATEAGRQAPIWQRAAQAMQSRFSSAAEGIRSRFSSIAEGIRSRMADAASKAASPWEQFSRRVGGLLKRVFVFSAILKGLNAVRQKISEMMMENDQFNASVQNLNSVLGGFAQSFVSAILPAMTALVNTLAQALARVASLVDSVFGTSIASSISGQRSKAGADIRAANAKKQAEYQQKVDAATESSAKRAEAAAKRKANAEEQYEKRVESARKRMEKAQESADEQNAKSQAAYEKKVAKAQESADKRREKAAERARKAQEKANRAVVLSFDELNKLDDNAAEDAEEYSDELEEIEPPEMREIDPDDYAVDPFEWADDYEDDLADAIAGIEPPELDDDWTQWFSPDEVFGNLLDWIDTLRDRILNDVEGPFARIREGLQQIAKGWGEVVEGLRTGDFGLVWKGITDIVIGACKVIEGAFGALMDWLDEQTGGRFTDIFQGLSEVVSGFEKVIEGILTGDFGLVAEGMGQVVQGLHQTVVGMLEGIKTAFGDLMDWLDEATGGQFHDVFEGLKGIVGGAADFLIGLLTLDIPRAVQGLTQLLDGLSQFVGGMVDAISGAIKSGVSWLFDYLSDKYPALSGFFQSTKDMILGVIDGLGTYIRSLADGAVQMVKGALDLIVGVFTLDGEKIRQGVDGLANGLRTIVDGLIEGLSTTLGSLFDWICDGVSGVFDFLASKFPEAEGLFEGMKQFVLGILDVLKNTVLGLLDGIGKAVGGFLDGMRQIIEGAMDVIAGIFTGSVDRIIEGLKGIVNGFISIVEGMLDGVITGVVGFVNGIADGLSNIPGVDIPSITFTSVNLPRLAGGAVIPPNREFLAVLGDQRHGNNIETPEALMRQVVREEVGTLMSQLMQVMATQPQGDGGDVVLVVGHTELARASIRGLRELSDSGELTGLVFD